MAQSMIMTMATPAMLDELVRYVDFSAADQECLRIAFPTLEPTFGSVIDVFYERLEGHPDARRVLTGDAQVARLRISLEKWIRSALAGPWDGAYFERRARIGHVHMNVGLPQRYMVTAMDVIRCELTEKIAIVYRDDSAAALAITTAVHKVLDIDLAIMLETYGGDILSKVRTFERQRAGRLASLGIMAAGLAHEIRNPLNAAQLQLMLVTRRLGPEQDRARDAAETVRSELERLGGLVQDFLAFARPNELRITAGDLAQTVATVVGLIGPEAEIAGVEMTVKADAAPLIARYDEERIKQVLLNLLRNAVEAAGAGGEVQLDYFRGADGIELCVEDTGPGLPTDMDVFEPFATTKETGTGLGLSIVHRIVSDHGGEIAARRVGGRTRFRISLPQYKNE